MMFAKNKWWVKNKIKDLHLFSFVSQSPFESKVEQERSKKTESNDFGADSMSCLRSSLMILDNNDCWVWYEIKY